MSALRGFGMTFDCASGRSRNWYVDEQGVKRWSENDEPCNPQEPIPHPAAGARDE